MRIDSHFSRFFCPLHLEQSPTRANITTEAQRGMGDGDGDPPHASATGDKEGTDNAPLEVACSCLNVRVVVRRVKHDDDGDTLVELDEDAERSGGAVRVVSSG